MPDWSLLSAPFSEGLPKREHICEDQIRRTVLCFSTRTGRLTRKGLMEQEKRCYRSSCPRSLLFITVTRTDQTGKRYVRSVVPDKTKTKVPVWENTQSISVQSELDVRETLIRFEESMKVVVSTLITLYMFIKTYRTLELDISISIQPGQMSGPCRELG